MLNNVLKDSNVYTSVTDRVVFVTKIGENNFAPGVTFVAVTNETIKAIMDGLNNVTETRQTKNGYTVKEIELDFCKASMVDLKNSNKMIEVEFKEPEYLKLRWFVDGQGRASYKATERHAYFANSGSAVFDIGFKRVQVKMAESRFDKDTNKYVVEFGEPQYIWIPTSGTAKGFELASKAMAVFQGILDFAKGQAQPQISDDIPF